jgi:hypothetical protein
MECIVVNHNSLQQAINVLFPQFPQATTSTWAALGHCGDFSPARRYSLFLPFFPKLLFWKGGRLGKMHLSIPSHVFELIP